MFKNIPNQKIRVFAFDSNGQPYEGDANNITCKLSKDNGIPIALEDTNPVETEDGFYVFDLTQEETNANILDFYPDSSTAGVVVVVPNHNRQTVSSPYIISGSSGSGLEEMIIVLRGLIGDFAGTVYPDSSLVRLLITSSIIVQREFSFDQKYTIDISSITITPDPEDNAFILFTAYKAAILLVQSEIKTNSLQSVKIVDGPSTIDLTSRNSSMKDLLKSLLDQYAVMRRDFLLSSNEGGSFGYAVITPTTVSYISGNNFS